MKDNGNSVAHMEKEFTNFKMDQYMMVNGKMVRKMVVDSISTQMVTFMKVDLDVD